MTKVTTVGLDLAKSVFQVHGADKEGRPVVRKKLCIAPGSLDTSLSHAAGLSDIAVCHA